MAKLRGKTRAIIRSAKIRKGQSTMSRAGSAAHIKGLRKKGMGKTARSYHQRLTRKGAPQSDL